MARFTRSEPDYSPPLSQWQRDRMRGHLLPMDAACNQPSWIVRAIKRMFS